MNEKLKTEQKAPLSKSNPQGESMSYQLNSILLTGYSHGFKPLTYSSIQNHPKEFLKQQDFKSLGSAVLKTLNSTFIHKKELSNPAADVLCGSLDWTVLLAWPCFDFGHAMPHYECMMHTTWN